MFFSFLIYEIHSKRQDRNKGLKLAEFGGAKF